MVADNPEADEDLKELEAQFAKVAAAVSRDPSRARLILTSFISNLYDAIKETVRRQGYVTPFYVMLSEPVQFGVPPVTEEVVQEARARNASAVVCVEGFQASEDIADLMYHINMSAPGLGVMGWVVKVRLSQGTVTFVRELPYHFDSRDKVKTLGELISEMESE
jgi:hypothetical protein